MPRARVVLAEDHAIVLDGLRRLLEPEFELAGTVSDGHSLVSLVRERKPDAVVADIGMPSLNGLDALRQIRKHDRTTRFVFLTANPEVSLAVQAIRLGASGYVLKHSATEELLTAIREALLGRTYITPRLAGEVLQRIMSGGAPAEDGEVVLTTREREVLQLLAEGKTIKEAANVLGVSPRTIEFHKANVVDKTGLHSTAELARFAARRGLVSDPS
jgi:DNA-binding NarL/FixJ family response regulator